jgi:DNA-binding NarL/FixJ family response regulator
LSAPISAEIPDAGRWSPDDGHRVRVLLADLDGPARHALADLLGHLPGVQLVGQVGSQHALREGVRRLRPHALVIDDRLVRNHVHVLSGLGPLHGDVRVIVVGVDDEPAFAARAHQLGATAWIAKDRADDELAPALLGTP